MVDWESYPEEGSDSEEDLAELEAELYSQIYYEQVEEASPDPSQQASKGAWRGKGASRGLKASSGLNAPTGLNAPSGLNAPTGLKASRGQEALSGQRSFSVTPYKTAGSSDVVAAGGDALAAGLSDAAKAVEASDEIQQPTKVREEEQESDVEGESRYGSTVLEINPFYKEPQSSEEEDDEGIIVLPGPSRASPVVVDLDDESSSSRTIQISDCEERRCEVVEETYELGSRRKKSAGKISDALTRSAVRSVRSERDYYREEYGSDFEDNFGSDDDDDQDVDESGISLGNLLGSSDPARTSSGKRKISDVFSSELAEIRGRRVDCPDSWTRDMDRFYNEVDPRLLDVELESELGELDPDAKHWGIDRADVYGGGRERTRYFGGGKKCHNCNQGGHMVRDCPEPAKEVHCSMCGDTGHRDQRCPEKCCLRCGNPGFTFQQSCNHCRRLGGQECRECRHLGHLARECPDLWRRFHLSTGPEVVRPGQGGSSRPDRDCWCCNCGRRGHLSEHCHKYRYSKYPVSTQRVVSYSQPRGLGVEPAHTDSPALKKSRLEAVYREAQSCPVSPAREEEGDQELFLGPNKTFRSQPSSPRVRSGVFPSSLLEHAQDKIEARKPGNRKKEMKEEKRRLIGQKLDSGMTRAQVLEDVVLLDSNKKNSKKVKKLKHLIRDCDQGARARKEMRVAEFQERRGFRRFQQTGFQKERVDRFPQGEEFISLSARKNRKREKQMQGGSEAISKREEGKGGKEKMNRSRRREEKITRAAMIPQSVPAAWKFLKKESQKITKASSEMGRRLKKDIQQEIFGLKNGLHSAPVLKKVERKRLADLVLNLRNHA